MIFNACTSSTHMLDFFDFNKNHFIPENSPQLENEQLSSNFDENSEASNIEFTPTFDAQFSLDELERGVNYFNGPIKEKRKFFTSENEIKRTFKKRKEISTNLSSKLEPSIPVWCKTIVDNICKELKKEPEKCELIQKNYKIIGLDT